MKTLKKSIKTVSKEKLLHIEIIRILAIFLVIFNHTGKNGYFLFASYPFATMPYFIYMTFSVFCKIAVPLFLMVSGALILKKDKSIKEIFKNKISKMAIVLFIFTALYYIRLHLLKHSDIFTIKNFFIRLYKGDITIPYWYIYAYISFLLSYPFLRAIVKSLPEYGYKYLIILSVFFVSIIPCLEYRFSFGKITLNEYGKVSWLFTNIVIYPLIGYYLENIINIQKINKKHILILLAFSIFGILASCYMTYLKHRVTGICNEEQTQDFMDIFNLPICIFTYLFVKKVFYRLKFNCFTNNVILSISSCTFGIYLIHIAILQSDFINNLHKNLTEVFHFNYMIAILLLCVLIMLICYFIVFLLKKIPGIKQLL